MAKAFKRTKIVCTIGPASWDPKVLKQMVNSGMNVARINGAFADVKELKRVADLVRGVSDDVALMLDIKGNDVRLNKFAAPITLKSGDTFIIGSKKTDEFYPANYPNMYKDLKTGARMLFDDGKLEVKLEKINQGKMFTKVVRGGELKPGKSINTPGSHLSIPPVTDFDKDLIAYAIKDKWEFIAASYVRSADDIRYIQKYTKNSNIQIVAKIEEENGVNNYEEILQLTDGIMVARGDMGVEMPFERIPSIQKMMIELANYYAKPVITATHVVESMTNNPMPTRAEISDAANAVFDGTDAVMTSAETTVGKYPVDSVYALNLIAKENEQYVDPKIIETRGLDKDNIAIAMANAAVEVFAELGVDKILLFTNSGVTARIMARYNLPVEILAFTPNRTIKNQLALTKGVRGFLFDKKYTNREHAIIGLLEYCLKEKLIDKTDKVVVFGKAYNISSKFKNIFEYIEIKNLANLK